MIFRYHHLGHHASVFLAVTGLPLNEFDQWVSDLLPSDGEAEQERLDRPDRQRAIGGGRDFALAARDPILLTGVWLRTYPTQEVRGYLYGLSDTRAGRVVKRVLPLLEQAGRDTMRMPDPGRKRRQSLPDLLADTPEIAVVIDPFEPRIQRHKDRDTADEHDRGKKKQNTLKSQVAVNEFNGLFVDVADRVPGPTADINVLAHADLLNRLPEGVGAIGDLAYLGIDQLHPDGLGAAPRRKPRGKPRLEADIAYNTEFSRRRLIVENAIGRLRRYEAVNQTDRHHRQMQTERVVAIAGLVNRQILPRFPSSVA